MAFPTKSGRESKEKNQLFPFVLKKLVSLSIDIPLFIETEPRVAQLPLATRELASGNPPLVQSHLILFVVFVFSLSFRFPLSSLSFASFLLILVLIRRSAAGAQTPEREARQPKPANRINTRRTPFDLVASRPRKKLASSPLIL